MKCLILLMIISGSIHSADAFGGFFTKYWKKATVGLFVIPTIHYSASHRYKSYNDFTNSFKYIYAALTYKYDTVHCKKYDGYQTHDCADPESRQKDCPKNSCVKRMKLWWLHHYGKR